MNTADNGAFSKNLPGFQTVWDSTSLGLLKECPWKYYLTMIEGFDAKGNNIHLAFGIAYHKGIEHYHKFAAEGLPHEEAVANAIRIAAIYFREADPETDSYKNLRTLCRSLAWHLDKFGVYDPAKTVVLSNGKAATELSFKFHLDKEIFGEPILLSGHFDRIAEFNDQTWVLDAKTTKSALGSYYFQRFTPDNQMSLYTVAADVVFSKPVAGVIVDAAQIAVGFTRFARGFATRPRGFSAEFLRDTIWWIEQASRMAQDQVWPMNDKSCQMYGGCPFREVCAKSPNMRLPTLQADFGRRVWDPTEAR